MRAWLFGIVAATTAASAAGQPPATPPALRCVYDLMKRDAHAQSVAAYSIDEVRSAIEFSFQDKTNRTVTADIMILSVGSPATYHLTILPGEPDDMGWEALDFLSETIPDGIGQCHIGPGLDSLIPQPSPHDQWRRVDFPN
ncbi:MAG TPA: hypothetical protein VMH86_16295 [Rhizomicrobium sp.]|nr:hypothetical protein [Rhizomicrobium sp.]